MKMLRVTLAGIFALLLAGCPPPQPRQPPRPQTQQSPAPQPPPQQPQQSGQSQAAKAEQKAEEAERRAEAAERAAEGAEANAQDAEEAARDASSRRAAEAARNQARIARQAADAARREADVARRAAQPEPSDGASSRDSLAAASASAAARDRSKEAAERAQGAYEAAAAASRSGDPEVKDAADAAARGAGDARVRAQAARDRAEDARQQAENRRQVVSRRQAHGAGNRSGGRPGEPAQAGRRGTSGPTGQPQRVPGRQPGDAWRVSRGDTDPRKRLPLPPLPESLGGEGRSFQDCEDCPAMAKVRGGSYIMGSPPGEWGRDQSEGPQHRVTIGYEFAVGIYEITKAEYTVFAEQSGHRSTGACLVVDGNARLVRDRRRNWRNPGFPQSPRDPVVCVSWRDAQAYTRWLSQHTGARYRLLSESEWEYAARGGSNASQFWGDNPDGACDYANGADLSAQSWIRTHLSASRNNSVARYYLLPLHECEDGYTATAPVGTYYPNDFGLHDMIANVDEWVLDCWNRDYRGAPANGAPWMRGNCSKRVARSGSWINGTRYNRVAHRDRSDPEFRHFTIGFRVARDL